MTKLLYWLIAGILSLILTTLISTKMGWAQEMTCVPPDLKPPIATWPKDMKITYHVVGFRTIEDICGARGCAKINVLAKQCDIWLSYDTARLGCAIKEELDHCAGWTHYY